MRKSNLLAILAILVFSFTGAYPSWGDEAVALLEEEMIEPSASSTLDSDVTEDERILDLEEQYSAYLKDLWEQIQNEADPSKAEQLQRKLHAVKEEREIVVKEIQLEIAIEQGDQAREMEILDALDALYEPAVALPSVQEAGQPPEAGSIKLKTQSKNPDDA
jgi:hypothetical protein